MKKLFFMGALCMAVGTIVPRDNQPNNGRTWSQWWDEKKQGAKKHVHRGKEHVKKHWKKYAAGAGAIALGTAGYLNRDRLGTYWTGRETEERLDQGGGVLKNKRFLTNEEREKVRELDSQYEQELKKAELLQMLEKLHSIRKPPSVRIWEYIREKLFGIPPKTLKDYLAEYEKNATK